MSGPVQRTIVVLLLLAPLPALADSLPPRKSGLWESKAETEMGPIVTKQCIDEKTDQLAQGAVGGPDGIAKACSKNSVVKTATGYATETKCQFGPMSSEGKGLITGDFNTAIRIETTTTMTGLPGQDKPVTKTTVIENRWVGPCAAGQKPGDIILRDGKVVKTPGSPK